MLPDRKRQNTRGKNYVVLARIGCPTRRQAANNKQVWCEGDAKGRGFVALPYGRGSLTLRSLCGLRADKWTVIQGGKPQTGPRWTGREACPTGCHGMLGREKAKTLLLGAPPPSFL